MFSVLAGVLSISGFDILGSKVLTRSDGVTINTFYLTGLYGGVFNNMRIRELFSRRVASALSDNRALDAEVAEMFYGVRGGARTNPFWSDVFLRRESGKTVLEVRGRDRAGLLYKIAGTVRDCGYDIVFARINTEAGWARDTFHICAHPLAETKAELVESLKFLY